MIVSICCAYYVIVLQSANTTLYFSCYILKILNSLKLAQNNTNGHNSDRKLTIFSGHDTVIAPVLAALGVYKQYCIWPPYASRIVVELYQASENASLYYLRVLYNGEDIVMYIPECQNYYLALKQQLQRQRDSNNNIIYTTRTTNRTATTSTTVTSAATLNTNTGNILPPPFLCPFEVFEKKVRIMTHPYKTIGEACRV